MNRNTKHPDRPAHKRRNRNGDRTRNNRAWRITASWNTRPDLPITISTPDRKARDRTAHRLADKGAYVIVEEHRGNGDWRTIAEYDGPAMLRERRAERRQQDAADARATAQLAQQRRQAATETAARARRAAQREATLDRLARVMVMPPVPRDATGRTTARHTTGR